MWTIILTVLGSLVGTWAAFKYILLVDMRIDSNTFKTLYEICKDRPNFVLQEECVNHSKYPVVFVSIFWMKDAPFFWLNHYERLLTAGWYGKESVSNIVCFRWSYRRMKKFLTVTLDELRFVHLGVPVELITPNYTDKVGSLKKKFPQPLQDEILWKDVDREVGEVFDNKRDKTGVLLYGPPGNGKTSLVKYLATKYQVPIKIITFSPEFSNHDLMSIFSQITPRSIVLFEDFDNYFHGRQCVLGTDNHSIKFTFDIILNGLDGVYNTYENVVFMMSVNDIDKVDYALKSRPSRFKFVRCFDTPSQEIIGRLLPAGWVSSVARLNLDQIMRVKEYGESGCTLNESLKKLIPHDQIEIRAYKRFLEREKNEEVGDHLTDWDFALDEMRGGK